MALRSGYKGFKKLLPGLKIGKISLFMTFILTLMVIVLLIGQMKITSQYYCY